MVMDEGVILEKCLASLTPIPLCERNGEGPAVFRSMGAINLLTAVGSPPVRG